MFFDENVEKTIEATKQQFTILLKKNHLVERTRGGAIEAKKFIKILKKKNESIHEYHRKTMDIFERLGKRAILGNIAVDQLRKMKQYFFRKYRC